MQRSPLASRRCAERRREGGVCASQPLHPPFRPQVPVPHGFDQPLNADLVLRLGAAPCVLPMATLAVPALGAALRRAAHPGPERDAMVAAARRAAGIIGREAEGAVDYAVRALERAEARWNLWSRKNQQGVVVSGSDRVRERKRSWAQTAAP